MGIRCGDKILVPGERTYIMGVVNVTPDSFSDGGQFLNSQKAVEHGLRLLEEGADILDIGGVATSPGSTEVTESIELARVLPVVEGLVKNGVSAISVDTFRANVAERALDLGAAWINDQHAALKDARMAEVLTKAQAVILMHNVGSSGVHAGERIIYDDVVKEIAAFFSNRINTLLDQGLKKENIIIDPGIGFGKGLKDSLNLINNMHIFNNLAAMTLIGVSRKSFLGSLLDISNPALRDEASLGAAAAAIASGAHIVRTHNVKATYDMVRVLDACKKAKMDSIHENLH